MQSRSWMSEQPSLVQTGNLFRAHVQDARSDTGSDTDGEEFEENSVQPVRRNRKQKVREDDADAVFKKRREDYADASAVFGLLTMDQRHEVLRSIYGSGTTLSVENEKLLFNNLSRGQKLEALHHFSNEGEGGDFISTVSKRKHMDDDDHIYDKNLLSGAFATGIDSRKRLNDARARVKKEKTSFMKKNKSNAPAVKSNSVFKFDAPNPAFKFNAPAPNPAFKFTAPTPAFNFKPTTTASQKPATPTTTSSDRMIAKQAVEVARIALAALNRRRPASRSRAQKNTASHSRVHSRVRSRKRASRKKASRKKASRKKASRKKAKRGSRKSKSKCRYGRKVTGRRGCKSKPGPKRGSRNRSRTRKSRSRKNASRKRANSRSRSGSRKKPSRKRAKSRSRARSRRARSRR
jgi:hypothetical protein